MARHAQDREDMLRDAKALLPRLMLKLPIFGKSCELFAGFRDDALSLYFDAGPVYQFNSARKLRRAFVDGSIIKAAAGRLLVWQPERTERQVAMHSRELSAVEVDEFLADLLEHLVAVCEASQRSNYKLVGQVPGDGEGFLRLASWLESVQGIEIAEAANVS